MSLLVESIKVFNGRFCFLEHHQQRLNQSQSELYDIKETINLRNEVQVPSFAHKGIWKCRVVYGREIENIQFLPYRIRKIKSIKIVHALDSLVYKHKFENRLNLDQLFAQRDNCDEILIIRGGFVTDAYYYNVVFQSKNSLFTPDNPLLLGVRRKLLLDKNEIKAIPISYDDIKSFEKLHLINALTPLNKIIIDLQDIVFPS